MNAWGDSSPQLLGCALRDMRARACGQTILLVACGQNNRLGMFGRPTHRGGSATVGVNLLERSALARLTLLFALADALAGFVGHKNTIVCDHTVKFIAR
jgi:hypothetical protein